MPRQSLNKPSLASSPTHPSTPRDILKTLAKQLDLPERGVRAVAQLLDDAATVPFIARYRKEKTGSLDELQIRAIAEGREQLVALESRRESILRSLGEQGISDSKLLDAIRRAEDRRVLEDLYLPHKPKRRSKATVARELGLDPLASRILEQPHQAKPDTEARSYVRKELPDIEAVWEGANDIVVDIIAQDPETRAELRKVFRRDGLCQSKASKEAKPDSKFRDYFEFSEPVSRIRGHRYLAMRRGEAEGELKFSIELEQEDPRPRIAHHHGYQRNTPYALHLRRAVEEAYAKRLRPSLVKELRAELDEQFDLEAVEVFAENLRQLLLAAPLGGKSVLGVDPGLRTGCKCVVVDETGKLLATETLQFLGHGERRDKAQSVLKRWIERYEPFAIAVGNGTGGREAEAFMRDLVKSMKESSKESSKVSSIVVSVNEAGASVYSASEVAREEFPDLDLTLRGAVSIARRLQDPLAELVKIEPKAIGVGQYQHDVPPALLERRLDAVVEDCVNQVGVQLNSASAPLLSRVAGVGPKQAQAIVDFRNQQGPFASRKALLKVAGMGPKKFEQCAGFLRVAGSKQVLDDTAVHPERYALVETIAKDQGIAVASLIGQADRVAAIDLKRYANEEVGEATLSDIFSELREPGRDPRSSFEAPAFRDDVQSPEDLKVGMKLQGIVTNVAAFGAFVDIGVHQDGLVHISKLKNEFVSRPSDVVSVGQRITVWVLDVDLKRRRIALSAVGAE